MDPVDISIVMILVMVVIVVVIARVPLGATKEQRQAKAAYENSLHMLTSDSTSSDLRQKTLALGRHYSNLMRDRTGNTIFDEMALMNDINAACAGAHHAVAPQTVGLQDVTVEERLFKLQSLRSNGLIDDDDFSRRKRQIMEQI